MRPCAAAQLGLGPGECLVAKAIARRAPAGGKKRSCGTWQRHARYWANAQAASAAPAVRSAPLLARESSRPRNQMIRLQQARFGRFS